MGKNQTAQITKDKNSNGSCALLPDRTEEVTKLAYKFYAERGYQHGHDQEDWLKAEAAVGTKKQKV